MGGSVRRIHFLADDSPSAMTIQDTARELFGDLGLDRDDVRVVAKSIGQQIVDESEQSAQSLTGMVYDVRTLYDEGMPVCNFEAPDAETVRFHAQFHAEDMDEQVKRRRVLDREEVQDLVDQLPTANGAGRTP